MTEILSLDYNQYINSYSLNNYDNNNNNNNGTNNNNINGNGNEINNNHNNQNNSTSYDEEYTDDEDSANYITNETNNSVESINSTETNDAIEINESIEINICVVKNNMIDHEKYLYIFSIVDYFLNVIDNFIGTQLSLNAKDNYDDLFNPRYNVTQGMIIVEYNPNEKKYILWTELGRVDILNNLSHNDITNDLFVVLINSIIDSEVLEGEYMSHPYNDSDMGENISGYILLKKYVNEKYSYVTMHELHNKNEDIVNKIYIDGDDFEIAMYGPLFVEHNEENSLAWKENVNALLTNKSMMYIDNMGVEKRKNEYIKASHKYCIDND
jgi:hypothetical protein